MSAFALHGVLLCLLRTPAQTSAELPPLAPAPSAQALGASGQPDAEGVYAVGRDVRPPVVVYEVNPELPAGFRRDRVSGDVVVGLVVDSHGTPQQVHVHKGFRNAYDEKAVEAVRQYRFRPGTKNGKPVPVRITLTVNFQTF